MSSALDNQNQDSEIQQAEEAARQAEAAQEQAEEAQEQQGSSGSSSQNSEDENSDDGGAGGDTSSEDGSMTPEEAAKQAEKAKKAAYHAAKDAKYIEQDAAEKGEIFDTRETLAAKQDIQARIEEIKDLLNSPAMKAAITGEATAAKVREKERIAQANAARYENSPIQRFKYSLNKFIKNELVFTREGTWKKFNKTYANSPIIRRGLASMESQNKPSINVYFDHSSSWDAEKIKVGMDAIGILNNYVRRGEIIIRIYYFGNRVSENPNDTGGGTEGTPILEHIQQTKPKNVIIMTDSDITDCTYTVKVPGAVWFLFKGGVSENIMSAVKGMKQNQAFYL